MNITILEEREVKQFLPQCTSKMVALLTIIFLKKPKIIKEKPWPKEMQNVFIS
jgi:hypothetical protein